MHAVETAGDGGDAALLHFVDVPAGVGAAVGQHTAIFLGEKGESEGFGLVHELEGVPGRADEAEGHVLIPKYTHVLY